MATTRTSRRLMVISTHGYIAAKPELGKEDTGGQVVYVLELSRHLAQIGYEVDILTRQFEDQPAEERCGDNVRVLRFPCGGGKFIPKEHLWEDIPEWTENVMTFIQQEHLHYDVINSHYWDAGVAGNILAEKLNIPHVHTPHSIGSWKRQTMEGDSKRLERVYNFSTRIREEKLIYEACDQIVATTPQQRFLLSTTNEYSTDLKKIAVIPPGYDEKRFFTVSDKKRKSVKRKWDAEGPVVLAIGRIAKNKGYDLLIKAMKTVVERVPNSRLILAIGSNNISKTEFRHLESLKQLTHNIGLDENVSFRGYVADKDLADYYHIADVFALSSRYDPFGMTSVEAMASGVPVVVTTHGGLWKLLQWGEEALYADPKDPEAFGHAIATILTYPKVASQLAEHGAAKARSMFSWSQIARQYDDILQNIKRN